MHLEKIIRPEERRRAARHSTRQAAWLRVRSGMMNEIIIVNFSTGGIGITVITPSALEVGERVEIAVDAPAHARWLAGTVMWTDGPRAGISFLGNGSSLIERLQRR